MFESFVLGAVSLGIVLYGQARILARDIRANRARHPRHDRAGRVAGESPGN